MRGSDGVSEVFGCVLRGRLGCVCTGGYCVALLCLRPPHVSVQLAGSEETDSIYSDADTEAVVKVRG